MKKLFLSLYTIILCIGLNAQTAWNNIYDLCTDIDRNSESVSCILDDNVIVTAGHTKTNGISSFHSYLAILGYDGQLVATKQLYSPGMINMIAPGYFGETKGNPLAKVSANKYVVAGVQYDATINTRIGVYHPFFYFFNSSCDSLRQVKYVDTILSHVPMSVFVDDQQNIVVSGFASSRSLYYDPWDQSYNWDSTYIWASKYDSNANLLWSKTFASAYHTGIESYKVIQSHDKKSYLLSAIDSESGLILSVDLNGNFLWKKRFLGRPDIIATSDNLYAFLATRYDINNKLIPYFGKLTNNGDTTWTKSFKAHTNDDVVGKILVEAENGDLLLLNYTFLSDTAESIRTTSKGNIKWYRTYSYLDTDYCHNTIAYLAYTSQRKIFIGGKFSTTQNIPNLFDTIGKYSWFVLTDTFGCIEPGCQVGDTVWWLTDVNEIAAKQVEINIYPNPSKDVVYIQAGNTTKKLHAALRDMSGRTLRNVPLHSNGKTPVDVADLPQGLYMVEVWDDVGRMRVMKLEHY